jgi:GNAT superfamily N-acetyltransferase
MRSARRRRISVKRRPGWLTVSTDLVPWAFGAAIRSMLVAMAVRMSVVTLRRLIPQDADLLRTIRLRSLQDAPSAFGSSYDRELSFTPENWRSRLRSDSATFVDEDADGNIAGLATGIPDADESSLARLVAMWVAPEARGTGVGHRLVAGVVGWARCEGFSAVRLRVTEGNLPAETLYTRHGFRRTGTTLHRERDGLTEIEMGLALGEVAAIGD